MASKRRHKQLASEEKVIKLRLLGLAVMLTVLVSLIAVSLWLRRNTQTTSTATSAPLVLDRPMEGAEFKENATAEEILAVADRVVDAICEKYPASPAALSAKARKLYQLGDSELAIEAWRQALELNPQFVEGIYGLGLVAFDRDQFQEAVGYFEDVQILGAGDPRVPVMLADAYMHLGRAVPAILGLEQHIKTEPTSVRAWLVLGQAYLQDKNYERATLCFEKILNINPDAKEAVKDAVYGMARATAALGRREEAKQFNAQFRQLAQEAREENAVDAAAFKDRNYAASILAQVYADAARVEKEQGSVEDAELDLLKATKLAPESQDFLVSLQQLYLQLQRPAEAKIVTERILELDPQNVEQCIRLGSLNAELGFSVEAIAAFEKAIALDPENEVCRQAAKMLGQL